MKQFDFIVIGGGVIGLTIAREIRRRFPAETIALLEKEKSCGEHASGRNSGVIHAGFYYSPDSLKAKLTRIGNIRLHQYCHDENIPLNSCGKIVVASNEAELKDLHELKRRGDLNSIPLDLLSESEAKKLEPRIKTFQQALFSPSTSSVDPQLVVNSLQKSAEQENIKIYRQTEYRRHLHNNILETTQGRFQAGFVVNCAGLYADKIAKDFGFSKHYRMLPFKGLYLYSSEVPGSLSRHVYPVPNLKNPFLGVHFTVMANGQVKIGPTATPIFWREQYNWTDNFKATEFFETLALQASLFVSSSLDFKTLAIEELIKLSKSRMAKRAAKMLEGISTENFRHWARPGIRAQLYDIQKRRLEMDFITEGNSHSFHILNAVSPAFTCCLSFAELAVDRMNLRSELARSTQTVSQ